MGPQLEKFRVIQLGKLLIWDISFWKLCFSNAKTNYFNGNVSTINNKQNLLILN